MLMRWLERLLQSSHTAVLGPTTNPRPWTFAYFYMNALRRHLLPFLEGEPKVTYIGHGRQDHSPVGILLAEQNVQVDTALFLNGRSGTRIVSFEDYSPLGDGSQSSLLLDRALFDVRQLPAFKAQAQRVLRPNGRLVVLANRVGGLDQGAPSALFSIESLSKGLGPEFSVVDYRNQGALGSWLRLNAGNWIGEELLRRPILRRLIAISRIPLFPLWIILKLAVSAVSLTLDWLDKSGKYYVSTVAVARLCSSLPAETAGTPQAPLVRAVE
jgi:hypothetical protein